MAVTILSQDGVADPAALTDLAQRATRADGDPPFSDQTLVDVRSARAGLRSVTATEDGALVGSALINPDSDQASTFTVELVVDPERRGAGIGAALAREVRGQVEGTVEAWAHGDHPGARRLAETYGLTAVRDLHRLKRGLRGSSDLPLPVDLAEGLEIRPFEQNRDENGWLRVNAQAFSDHPEQGRMTLDDLRQREAEEWFDAPGFLLAVRADDPEVIQGFHWTKIHPASDGSPAMGEVYVVGISPEQQGRGLGKALTAAGINYLAGQDLEHVMLYVDGDNAPAMALYEKLGFERWHLDVMFRGEITG